MTRLLFLSYDFPPVGGAGVQRGQRLARHLVNEHGFELVVVTGPAERRDRWSPRDETLVEELPRTNVFRLAGPEPDPGRAARVAERWLLVRSRWTKWWIEGAVQVGREAGRDVDLIYAHMQPYASAEAAARLAAILDVPWIADLGDPWALDEMWIYPTGIHRWRDRARMRRLLNSAGATIMSTPEAVARVRKAFPELADRPVVAIPNGYEAAALGIPAPPRNDGKFRIVHTGFLHTELGLRYRRFARLRRLLRGAPIPGVNVLARSHVYLLKALDHLLRDDPSLASTIELHLAGVLSATDVAFASRSPLVHLHGYLPHAEAVKLVRSADLLFLPMQDLPPGVRAGLVPGKTYEYLATGLPILAAVPSGDARDLLVEARTGYVVAPTDAEGMATVIKRLVATSREDLPTVAPEVLQRYDYRNLARQLADLFTGVLAEGSRTRARGNDIPQTVPGVRDEPSAAD